MPGYRRIADEVTHRAQDVYEHVRAINHAIITRPPLPASDVYPALASLAESGRAIAQGLGQLGECLDRSVDAYELHNDDGSDPRLTLERVQARLADAIGDARRLGADLAAACGLLATQSHRGLRPSEESTQRAADSGWADR